MKKKDLLDDLSSIKNIMERSTKFISLSGLSGVMAGVYALVGAGYAFTVLQSGKAAGPGHTYRDEVIVPLVFTAIAVLILSVSTGIWLTIRKARRKGLTVWNPVSKALLLSGGIPLATGGLVIIILLLQRHFAIISAGCLIFYGLALVSASHHTFGDVKWLGIFEVIIGLAALAIPGYGFLLWVLGFGVMHILYGAIMHFKYDREVNA
ncbi:hypothetical protein BEL04_22425 [Mucilaginibacter sp. PPCGB 2223]|uniref:hypothetical protein n=1 Tax=Mucilaginibacter sp. PPCGB 2223 TaxID=1886027 RepID=UPI000825A6E6|nr:hypothetical protein [Mucilaginibacter sp. PPCGB 2223]OCX50536.1 hypothetical protein BEL04_22425 [Mucilaginibacter sp. PPCGB 2223]